MKVKFSDTKLDIGKVPKIRTMKIRNYSESIKFHFPPGAIEIGTYYSEKRWFDSLNEFTAHVLAMPYMDFDCFRLPKDNVTFELITLGDSTAEKIIAGAFNSFLDFSRNTFLKFSITAEQVGPTFQLDSTGSGVTLFFETTLNYVCFYEQPID